MPDATTQGEIDAFLQAHIASSSFASGTDYLVSTSTDASSSLTGQEAASYNNLISADSDYQTMQLDQQQSMDYSMISALLLLWLAIITTFDFLRRHSSKDL